VLSGRLSRRPIFQVWIKSYTAYSSLLAALPLFIGEIRQIEMDVRAGKAAWPLVSTAN
jgi:hypothetical protein